jgi:hypothetical protein
MKTHDQIIQHLAREIPFVHIQTNWERDDAAVWEKEWGKIGKFCAWVSEVKAACIHNGKLLTGSGHLGGTWKEAGKPHDPDINGYFPQKCQEALEELALCMDEADANASAVLMVRGAAAWCCDGKEVEA